MPKIRSAVPDYPENGSARTRLTQNNYQVKSFLYCKEETVQLEYLCTKHCKKGYANNCLADVYRCSYPHVNMYHMNLIKHGDLTVSIAA